MSTTTMNAAPAAPQGKDGRWKELAIGVAYLMGVGTAFTGIVALAAALFTGA